LVPALTDLVQQARGLLHQPGDLLTDALLAERPEEEVRERDENNAR
jgi:hypothetical protein